VVFDGEAVHRLPGERHPDGAAHGSGCTHSSVLAAQLALGATPLEAARTARRLAGEAVRDGLRGLGAGAGNAPTEVLAAVLERAGRAAGVDLFALMDAAEQVVAPMMPFQPIADRASLTIGYAGVYSTFLLHANRLAERFGLDAREILLELGRRKAVAGQEDWVLDVAVELAGQTTAAARRQTTRQEMV
jgi:4-hydroxy-2-oxovalerate aldolase